MEMYDTRDFRKGLKVEFNNEPYVIVDFQHHNPGKGASLTRLKIRNLRTGALLDTNVKSGDKLPKPDIENRMMQFLYRDGTDFHFMDTSNYEQLSLTEAEVADNKFYIQENDVIKVIYFGGKPITIETEIFAELKVVETQPGIKGDTAQGGSKPARLSTGLVVTVPLHINEGDVLKIDSREGNYVEKVNKK